MSSAQGEEEWYVLCCARNSARALSLWGLFAVLGFREVWFPLPGRAQSPSAVLSVLVLPFVSAGASFYTWKDKRFLTFCRFVKKSCGTPLVTLVQDVRVLTHTPVREPLGLTWAWLGV